MALPTEQLRELSIFTGAGGGLLASRLLGWSTKCAVEIDPYARNTLLRRQREGHLESFPIWDDVTTFDGKPWRGSIDVVTGGFPCQNVSSIGDGKGLGGEGSSLWFEMLRVVAEVRPSFVFAENSPLLRTRGLSSVVLGLAELGYDCRWGVLGARPLGGPHRRNRLWLRAHLSDPLRERLQGKQPKRPAPKAVVGVRVWGPEPRLDRVADGVANRMDRVRAIGNGQVPLVAATAWRALCF